MDPKGGALGEGVAHAGAQGLGELRVIRRVVRCGPGQPDDFMRDLQRIPVLPFFQKDQRAGDGVDPGKGGLPLIELHPVFGAVGVPLHELDEPQMVRGVPRRARPVLEAKKNDQAMVIQDPLMEQPGAIFGAEVESMSLNGWRRGGDSCVVKVQEGFHPMHAPAIGFILFQPHRRAQENDLPPVRATSDTGIVIRVKRPFLKEATQVYERRHRRLSAKTQGAR